MTFGVQWAPDHLRDGTATARFIVFKMKIIVHCIMRETRVQSLGREDPLEKAMATHSSMLLSEFDSSFLTLNENDL